MNLPLIVVNFKLFEQATGDSALKLAKIHEKVALENNVSIAIAVNAIDLARVAGSVSIPVFVQHMDPVRYGSHTGHILPDLVKEAGAFGVLLNHAECQLEYEMLERTIERAKEVDLFTIVCANSPEKAERIAKMNPDLIAVEPPELIGGDISVSKAKPEIIEKSVHLVGENKLLVGAGVKNADDVRIALTLGAVGVLLASGVTRAADPEAVLLDLISGLK